MEFLRGNPVSLKFFPRWQLRPSCFTELDTVYQLRQTNLSTAPGTAPSTAVHFSSSRAKNLLFELCKIRDSAKAADVGAKHFLNITVVGLETAGTVPATNVAMKGGFDQKMIEG